MTTKTLAALQGSAAEKLEQYTAKDGPYAFNTYDCQEAVDGPIKPADVLMANLLNLGLRTSAIIPLFKHEDGPAQQLREELDNALIDLKHVQPYEFHESFADLEQAVQSIAAANTAAISVKWWTAVAGF